MKAQGATEYLVLLAVVLIVALVSVALLGFFPGMASDAQMTQSKTYWSSASPIAIVEASAEDSSADTGPGFCAPYLKIRNTGAYPITITKILAGTYSMDSYCHSSGGVVALISSAYYMAPGEERFFGTSIMGGSTRFDYFYASGGYASGSNIVSGLASQCTNSPPWGTLVMPGFGFEYVEYLDNGQQLTKREMGAKPLVVKCIESSGTW